MVICVELSDGNNVEYGTRYRMVRNKVAYIRVSEDKYFAAATKGQVN